MKKEYVADREAEKGEAFRLLSNFFRLPEEDMVANLKALENKMNTACGHAVCYVSKMRAHFVEGGNIEPLIMDFSRLFVGPFTMLAPPYGSMYLEDKRTVMGESTMAAVNRYREEGLDISSDFRNAPDHIAAELEFIYFLIFKAREAAMLSDMDAYGRYLDKRKRFLMEHIGAWISDFQRIVEKSAETDFYKNLARATKILINKDLEEVTNAMSHHAPSEVH